MVLWNVDVLFNNQLLVLETNILSILPQTRKFKLTGVRSLHCQDPSKSGLLLFKPIHSQRWPLGRKEAKKKKKKNLAKIFSIHMSKILKFIQKTLSLTEKHSFKLYKKVF